MKLYTLLIGLILPLFLCAQEVGPQSKIKMIENLEYIRNTLETSYAPAEWKKIYCDWDLDAEYAKACDAILADDTLTLKKYQRILKSFLASTKDYHVGIFYYSTEFSHLPFNVKSTKGKYFISSIDYGKLSQAVYPINIGDELIEFDGKPIEEVIASIKAFDRDNNSEKTDQAFAEIYLTNRMGFRSHECPKGAIEIKLKSKINGEEKVYQLLWEHSPELIASPNLKKDLNIISLNHPFINKNMTVPLYEEMAKYNLSEMELGRKTGFLPPLGKVLWSNDENKLFQAYLFQTPDQRLIGYIRIPSYRGSAYHVQEFEEIINYFQNTTDALVIDQLSNPGGSVFYLYSLASMLTDKALKTSKHRMTINQGDVHNSIEMIRLLEQVTDDKSAQEIFGKDFIGIKITYQFVQYILDYCRFYVSEWNKGKLLTDPYHIFGVDQINPHPTSRYTKPILLLINELDISGGDFFPAIMQDNNRVTTMGVRTAGAGGYVLGISYPNKFGILSFRYTASIAERPGSGLPIENLGVTPDIPYELSESDLKYNYKDFVAEILKVLGNL